ncbi:hypothetical protein CHS0354_007242 [Potamilus streckersoni]|uniref:Uncharacterized protein n=1 Tax=Potamilus streckersoni TaxID=2493646 RepID=A0AAE0TD61_9BIVA|nr:hypothetical protein CHS0354_007242 [Potamilus streckersoni]
MTNLDAIHKKNLREIREKNEKNLREIREKNEKNLKEIRDKNYRNLVEVQDANTYHVIHMYKPLKIKLYDEDEFNGKHELDYEYYSEDDDDGYREDPYESPPVIKMDKRPNKDDDKYIEYLKYSDDGQIFRILMKGENVRIKWHGNENKWSTPVIGIVIQADSARNTVSNPATPLAPQS